MTALRSTAAVDVMMCAGLGVRKAPMPPLISSRNWPGLHDEKSQKT